MSAQLKVELLLAAIDKVTAPLDAMKVASKKLATELGEARRELKGLEGARLKINDLQHTNVELKQLKDKLAAAAGSAERAQQALINAEKPTTKLKIAAREAARAHRELIEQESALIAKQSRLSASLKEAGIDTGKLGKEEQALKAKITATTQSIDAQTKALERHAQRASDVKRINEAASKMQGYSSAMKSAGTQAVITGGVMAAGLSAPIKAFADAEDAAMQLKVSMMGAGGQVQAEFEQVNQLAMNLGNRLPGTTADFQNMMTALQRNGIDAKSVLAGVGESAAYLAVSLKMPTEEAAVFAAKMKGALKATDSEMMGVMDTIQKGFNLGVTSDAMLAGYSKMTPALRVLRMEGDAAAKALAPLLIQANKMGMAGESAGNAFQKVIRLAVQANTNSKGQDAAKAAGVQALNFNDKNGNFAGLENAYKELEKLKGLSDEARANVISAYFGNDAETMQALGIMIDGGVDGYKKVQADMEKQADLQTRVNKQLSTLANIWDAAKGTFMNALVGFGESMGGDLKGLADKMGKLSERTGAWMKDHPTMTKWIGRTVLALTGLSIAFGATALAAGFVLSPFAKVWKAYKLFGEFKAAGGITKFIVRLKSLGGWLTKAGGWFGKFASSAAKIMSSLASKLGSVVMRMGGLIGKLGGLIGRSMMSIVRGVMMASRFLMANPIILIITAIAIAAYLIYRNWGKIAPFIKGVWDKASAYISNAWARIKSSVINGIKSVIRAILSNPIVQFYIKVWSAVISYMVGLGGRFVSIGADIISGLWNGLKSKWASVKSWLMDAVASLPDGVKSVLGINSPSKVFAKIGGGIMGGLHMGMDKTSGKAIALASKIAKRITAAGTPQMAFAGYAGQPRQGTHSLAQTNRATRSGDFNMGGVNITINAQPGMSAEDIGREVRREMDNLHRQQKMRAKASYLDRD